MAAPQSTYWKPGTTPYKDFLDSLTPEQKKQHFLERKQRKTAKKAYEIAINELQAQWIARINEGMVSVLNKAIRDGDPAALACVFDRIIGKPTETIQSDTNLVLPWNTEEPINDSDDDEDDDKDSK